jgi:hypothetical protein
MTTTGRGRTAPSRSGRSPQAQRGRASPEEQNLGAQTIEVYDDRIDPRQLEIMAAQPVQIHVSSQGSTACTFFIGPYLSGLQVAPGETAHQSLTVPTTNTNTNFTRETMDMGCEGDEDRQGNALIEFRGPAPGAGR